MKDLAKRIRNAKQIVLTTHRQCDGDGLGAQLALFFAIRKIAPNVRVINVDPTPRKYRYLQPDQWIQYYSENQALPAGTDLVLIFDTNDSRLVEPLLTPLLKDGADAIFLDHHPVLLQGPKPSSGSYIDILAASTGEIAYRLIKELRIPLDRDIARAIYTSITFDTQLYRFIRNSPASHLIAAELLDHNIDPEEIHRHLFGNQTVQKMAFLSKALGRIEYHCQGRLAILRLSIDDLAEFGLDWDESRDVIDMIMSIETLEAAAMFREDKKDEFKISLRSKGQVEVLSLAEALGGGGHMFASGAYYQGNYDKMKKTVLDTFIKKLPFMKLTGS
jgi:bifunctional oligoribonuclease and PAP phosphatase NrnA